MNASVGMGGVNSRERDTPLKSPVLDGSRPERCLRDAACLTDLQRFHRDATYFLGHP